MHVPRTICTLRKGNNENLYHFRDRAIVWSKVAIVLYAPCIQRPHYGGYYRNIAVNLFNCSSRLQLDMRNLSLGRRHLVNAYEVEAGIGVIAGNTV